MLKNVLESPHEWNKAMHLQRVGGRRERKRGEIHLHLVYKKKNFSQKHQGIVIYYNQ